MMRITYPCVVDFYGCSWDAEWEFDCPAIVYEPIKSYTPFATSIPRGVVGLVDDFCSHATDGTISRPPFRFSEGELKEFKWRGWSIRGFKHRRGAFHVKVRVRFYRNHDREKTHRITHVWMRRPGLTIWERQAVEV